MRSAITYMICGAVFTAFGALLCYVLTDPASVATQAQSAVLADYLRVYCNPPPPSKQAMPGQYLGEAAESSRVVIAAGLGTLARAELLRCQAGLSR